MQEENSTVIELAKRLSGRVVVSSDLRDSDFSNTDIEALTARISAFFDSKQGAAILTKEILDQIIKEQKEEKIPTPIEILRSSDFRPSAKDINENFWIKESRIEKTGGTVNDFTEYFRDRFQKLKTSISSNRRALSGMLNSVDAIKQYATGREVSIVGMVYDKRTTKKGNILLTLEDEDGTAKVLFVRSAAPQMNELFESARRLVNEDIIAVRGKMYNQFLIVNSMIWPDIPVRQRRVSEDDTAVAFISDVHIGSKLFLEKQFSSMLKWLNGNLDYRKDLAGKIKYIIINGDIADGIGVYPGQDKDLAILDIYRQYSTFFNFMNSVPDYVQVFVMPGNHDAVQRAEPQPALPKEFIGDFSMPNLHVISNPSCINIDGVNILAYHGTSLDSIIQSIPNCSYSKPEVAMIEVLKRRHLSPIYGGNMIVPTRNDAMLIEEIPDVLHMGHVHRNGTGEYHGTLILNSGAWQAKTVYQIKQGHIPTPAILPVYETRSMRLSNMDFNNF